MNMTARRRFNDSAKQRGVGRAPLIEARKETPSTARPRAAREYAWSPGEVGLRAGVSRQAINAIETGKYDPEQPLAMQIARLFERHVEDILGLEEDERCGPST
jgi:putative transcriptional regulator